MMMADALIDIPSIRRIDKLENVQGRRHSTGKVIMPSGGLTVLSRYLRASQASCHDMCKYGTGFSQETEPNIPRCPMGKIVAPKRGAGRDLERVSESKLGGRRRKKKSEISGNVSPDCKIQESDDPVVISIEQTQGHHLQNVEEDLTDTKSSKVGVEPSDDAAAVINIAQTQGHHLENIEEDLTDTKNSKVCVEPSGDDDPVVINIAQTRGHHLGNVEEDLTDTKNSEVSVKPSDDCEPKSPEYPAISVKPSCEATAAEGEAEYEETAETKSLRGEKDPQVCMKSSPDSESQKPVDLKWTDEESVLPQRVLLSIEEASYEVAHGKDSKPKPQSKPSSLIRQACSSGKQNTYKSMKQNQNRTPIVRTPRPYEKKNMIYKPKGIHAGGLPPSLPSFPGRKSLRPTPNGLNITQPSLASSSLLASSMSSHNDTSAGHDKSVAEKQKSSSKMMYKARPKKASMITPNNKHLPGKQLNFQRGKRVEIPVEDCTPRRLTFKKRELVDNRNDDNRKGKFENFSTRRLKFRQRANLDNIHADNQNGRAEEFTPRRLKFRRREIVDNKDGDNQNSRIEEFSPRRLEFRRKLIVDNINGAGQNGSVEEFSPRKLEFRRKLIVDNINGAGQNGRVEGFSPRRLEFRRKLIVDNINGDGQNGSVEEFSPRKLEFRRKLIVDNINGDDQNGCGEDSSPRKLIFRPKVVDEKKIGYIQNGSGILYNNIIEEAASRLASTKASKVKALVSAFETVISHLDGGISDTDNRN